LSRDMAVQGGAHKARTAKSNAAKSKSAKSSARPSEDSSPIGASRGRVRASRKHRGHPACRVACDYAFSPLTICRDGLLRCFPSTLSAGLGRAGSGQAASGSLEVGTRLAYGELRGQNLELGQTTTKLKNLPTLRHPMRMCRDLSDAGPGVGTNRRKHVPFSLLTYSAVTGQSGRGVPRGILPRP
jgi:hypothetical protein